MKAVIMAGGEGRRLKSITGERPKPMVPLLGRPMMEHILLLLKKHGFDEVCAAVKYRAEDIMRYFGDGSASACGSNTASSARRWARRAA